jgi:aminoglycoside phosphotransferase (APT) family kinase protein
MPEQKTSTRTVPFVSRPPRGPNPDAPAEVAADLLGYLRQRWEAPALAYAEKPAPLGEGWETYVYSFRLRGPSLSAEQAAPLVLRLYSSPHGVARAGHEFAVLRYLAGQRYPAPKPLLLETDCRLFGGPFLVVERIAGRTMFETIARRPWHVWAAPVRMARAQAALHALPAAGFPAPARPFLARELARLRALIAEHGLHGLAPGLDWLRANRPPEPRSPSVVHLDFHALNLIVGPGRLGVLDWADADVGDVHADVAASLVVIDCTRDTHKGGWARPLADLWRCAFRKWYLDAYRARRPLDEATLAYYRAWAALRRLCCYGGWLAAGPCASGCKPAALGHLTPTYLDALRRYFTEHTGVEVQFEARHLPVPSVP